MAKPIPVEEFAALVTDLRGELASADAVTRAVILGYHRPPPKAWEGYSWVRWRITVEEVMRLTGYTRESVVTYNKMATRARREGKLTTTYRTARKPHLKRLMPPPVQHRRERCWIAGEIAIWLSLIHI